MNPQLIGKYFWQIFIFIFFLIIPFRFKIQILCAPPKHTREFLDCLKKICSTFHSSPKNIQYQNHIILSCLRLRFFCPLHPFIKIINFCDLRCKNYIRISKCIPYVFTLSRYLLFIGSIAKNYADCLSIFFTKLKKYLY